MRKIADLDVFDRRLLERVRRNNLEPARILAEQVGLSISAVLRRLRRLREEGVIVADIAVVNPALTGSALTLHVLVRMREPGRRALDAFSKGLSRYPQITGAWEVTGDDDYILKVQVGSMAEYDSFTRQALGDDNCVLSFKTLITISTIVEGDASTRPLIGG
ncbi:MAG: Lrp/AsnC family transcriptional regulator [Sphingobium sp.]